MEKGKEREKKIRRKKKTNDIKEIRFLFEFYDRAYTIYIRFPGKYLIDRERKNSFNFLDRLYG